MSSRRTSCSTTSGADPALRDTRRARRTRRAVAIAVVLACAALLAACEAAPERPVEPPGVQLAGEAMGTRFSVLVPGAAAADEGRLAEIVRAELDAVDRAMSTWKAESEISRLNRAPAGEPFPVSEATFEVLALAAEIAARTGGAFDVTVGPLVEAWGFGPEGMAPAAPTESEIARLRTLTGPEALRLDPVARTATKGADGVHVDLSAIAKGYSVDRVASALAAAGQGAFMVEVGGEVVTAGRPEPDRPWRIGIENPLGGIQRLLPLEGAALASSGDYRNFYELDGRLVSHTIDPRTGRPVEHVARAVTVLAVDCATADALATALMVMGPEEGVPWADAAGVAALWLLEVDGAMVERPSRSFADRPTGLQ